MDLAPNHTAFFHWKYELATAHFKDGEHVQADEMCKELLADFVCPRLIWVHALQLRSLCTNNYEDAKSHLLCCFEILDNMPAVYPDVNLSDPIMVDVREHTQKMLDDLEKAWQEASAPAATENPEQTAETHDAAIDSSEPSSLLDEQDKEELEGQQ